ncbi:hypothetical protein H311_01310, partial [Anncaliia algerae PRA109]
NSNLTFLSFMFFLKIFSCVCFGPQCSREPTFPVGLFFNTIVFVLRSSSSFLFIGLGAGGPRTFYYFYRDKHYIKKSIYIKKLLIYFLRSKSNKLFSLVSNIIPFL